eukprot:11856286-Karenia_brevis.AAC.1
MISWKCDCSKPLMRRVFPEETMCDGCGDMIPARSRRLMCEIPDCAFHICNSCKAKAETGATAVTEHATEPHKRTRE